jgi:hypothetical protein
MSEKELVKILIKPKLQLFETQENDTKDGMADQK